MSAPRTPVLADRTTLIQGHLIHLADSETPSVGPAFHPDDSDIEMCGLLSGLTARMSKEYDGAEQQLLPLCLSGPAGVGKRELIHALAIRFQLKLYSIIGHEEMTAEDLVLAVVPVAARDAAAPRLVLRASPLATALLGGGLFFFERVNRTSVRALAALSSVLDERQILYSSIAELWIKRQTAAPFVFCCSMDDESGTAFPPYIEQRLSVKLRIKRNSNKATGLGNWINRHATDDGVCNYIMTSQRELLDARAKQIAQSRRLELDVKKVLARMARHGNMLHTSMQQIASIEQQIDRIESD